MPVPHIAPSPSSGEVIIMLGGPNPAEVRAGLDAMFAMIEQGPAIQWASDAEDTAFLAHVTYWLLPFCLYRHSFR